MVLMVAASFTFATGCKKSEGDSASGTKGKEAAKTTKAVKVGDSCKGISATAGLMACDGNTKMFCSSVSKYTWKSLGDCKAPQKCVAAAGGKSVSCK